MNPTFLSGLLTLLRSAGVGILATATDLGMLALLVSVAHVSPRAASIPALVLGISVQFFGNKLFAFGDRSQKWVRQGAQFLGVETLGLVANLALYDLAVTHTKIPYLVARMLSTSLVYFCICLPLWSRIFRPEMPQLEEQS